ncbi:MAG: molybdate ABC transporter permease subunit [Phyllobacteriaceae bacterium]|nr:molybdate ABC transporter permease subunit [Phyllobacteriaceae bacterium]
MGFCSGGSDELTADEIGIVWLSIKVAAAAMAFALPPALATAWMLARGTFRGKGLLQAVVTLPLVLPPVVTGYALLAVFSPNATGGRFVEWLTGAPVAFTWKGAALAAAVMAFPVLVRPIRQALEAVDAGLEEAARTLGANRWRALATITLPLAAPGLLAGLVLGFAKALGEFGATITFVSSIPGETQTLSLAIYGLLQSVGGEGPAGRLMAFSVVLAVGAILASEALARRLPGGGR